MGVLAQLLKQLPWETDFVNQPGFKTMTILMYKESTKIFKPRHPAKWLGLLAGMTKGSSMNDENELLDEKVLLKLVEEIGLPNTRRFMEALDNEFQKRITNIRKGRDVGSFAILAAEAHALKSSAQICGAFELADVLTKLETTATRNNNDAFALAQESITLADLTRFAFLDVKLEEA